MESINLKKNPLRKLGESTDKLRANILAYDKLLVSYIISDMLYRGEYQKAYKRCSEVFGETHMFTYWAYDLALQWERLTGKGE